MSSSPAWPSMICIEDPNVVVEYPIVEFDTVSDKGKESFFALNEVAIKGIETTLVAQLNINDEKFEMFRGDGICISTPSGSTAYNKGLGGALIHPSIEAVQIAEIASINNRIYRTLGSSDRVAKASSQRYLSREGQAHPAFDRSHLPRIQRPASDPCQSR